ncbi:MAG: hypothetical protein QM817_30640 [Archangium sp.]
MRPLHVLPPIPHSTANAHHLLWHPTEKKLWLLDLHGKQLWRVEKDGTGELLFRGDALGLDSLNLAYQHASGFHFDAARKGVVWFVATYDRVLLFVQKNKSFVEVKLENGFTPASADVFVFDPKRNVLVHFVSTRAMSVDENAVREARGGTTVRELGVDGTWKDVGTPLPSARGMYTVGGWDAELGMSVLVDDAKNETWGWNGKEWKKLGLYPFSPWQPFTAGQSPKGGLVIVQKERGQSETAQIAQLEKGKWSTRDAIGLTEWGGLANGFIAGPWFGAGTLQATLGTYDGNRILPTGRPVPQLEFGSVSGTPRFFGTRSHVRTNAPKIAPLKLSTELKSSGSLADDALAHFAETAGDFSVKGDGEVLLDGKPFAKAPKAFVARTETNFGGDGAGTLMLVGGEVTYGSKRLTDTWRVTNGKFEQLAVTGKPPVVTNALVGFHAPSATWVVCGGRDKNYRRPNTTSTLDGKKWASFPSKLSDEKRSTPETYDTHSLLASDGVSGELLLVRGGYFAKKIYAWRGEGKWLFVASCEDETLTGFAWDQATRSIVAGSSTGTTTLQLGAKLDALPRPKGSKPLAPKIAKQVWLQRDAGDAHHFWFAHLEGTGWVERWGARSPAAKLKTKRHAKAETYAAAVQARLDAGFEHAPEKELAAVVDGRTSFRPKFGKKGDDLAGGVAPGITAKQWPHCEECKKPMTHLLTLNAHPQRLPLKKHAALSAFICNNEETAGICETWDPDYGSSAVLLSKSTKGGLKRAPGDQLSAFRLSYEEKFEPNPEHADEEDAEAVPKVNGYPGWLQQDATPNCGKCKKPMRFVAQIGEFDDALGFAGGDAYIFCCESEHGGAVLWQH